MKRYISQLVQTQKNSTYGCGIHFVKRALSYYGMAASLLALVAVLISYVYGLVQPVRWPSMIYFLIALMVTLFSKRWATYLLIFSLPLLPDLHTQISYIKSPAVPYFVNYPGLDMSVGFVIGLLLLRITDKTDGIQNLLLPPWTAGLVLLVLSISTAAAVVRNLWQINAEFTVVGLLNNALRFKLINPLNDYFPIASLIICGVAVLLFTLLLQVLKQERLPNEVVFRPVVLAAGVAAIWGIVQGITAFGLSEQTINYRPASWGYGATGFQPDIHAFGAHMLIGTVGLFGYITLPHARSWRNIIFLVMLLSCVALILSKSRASTFLLVVAAGLYLFLMLRRADLTSKTLKLVALFVVVAGVVGLSQSIAWMKEINAALENSNTSWFQKINEISRYRLEIFMAALRLFATAPFLGIGNGNFLRVSRNPELTGTNWFIVEGAENAFIDIEGGDNAHNYFLQILAETGLIGIVACALFFIYPVVTKIGSERVRPVVWGMIAIALGNVYSHSLIIRENLFLLVVFCALLYAGVKRRNKNTVLDDSSTRIPLATVSYQLLGTALLVTAAVLGVKELRSPLENTQTAVGYECFRPSQKTGIDGWSSGMYTVNVPIGTRYIYYSIDDAYGIKPDEFIPLHVSWYDTNRKLVLAEVYNVLGADFPAAIEVQVPVEETDRSLVRIATLTSNFCFTPANQSFTDDTRRLSMKVVHTFAF
jgi:O-antigen ligase